MLRVGVDEAQLRLPISLAALSGNGSFTSYGDLFRDKCEAEYSFADWVLDQGLAISGLGAAKDQWEEGHRLAALWIVMLNLVVFFLLLHWLVRCVQQGNCYRLCSPSSVEERETLTEDAAATESAADTAADTRGADKGIIKI